MLAFDQDTWTMEQEIPTQARRQSGTDELDRDRLSRAATPDPDDEDLEDDEDLDLDDDDELELDDDDLEDDDVVPDYEEEDDLDDDDDTVDDPLRASIDEDDDEIFDLDSTDPDEIPEREEADNEDLGYPSEQEVSRPQEGNDTNFSEQIDVTPPTPHEFPSVGNPKTDFTSRNAGRTTGRMLGHEPGTEGI